MNRDSSIRSFGAHTPDPEGARRQNAAQRPPTTSPREGHARREFNAALTAAEPPTSAQPTAPNTPHVGAATHPAERAASIRTATGPGPSEQARAPTLETDAEPVASRAAAGALDAALALVLANERAPAALCAPATAPGVVSSMPARDAPPAGRAPEDAGAMTAPARGDETVGAARDERQPAALDQSDPRLEAPPPSLAPIFTRTTAGRTPAAEGPIEDGSSPREDTATTALPAKVGPVPPENADGSPLPRQGLPTAKAAQEARAPRVGSGCGLEPGHAADLSRTGSPSRDSSRQKQDTTHGGQSDADSNPGTEAGAEVSDARSTAGSRNGEAAAATLPGGPTNAATLGDGAPAATTVNGMTPVNPPSPSDSDGLSGPSVGDASPSAATRAVETAQNSSALREPAQGAIVHPELGRVLVSARMRDGEVDVRISAERPQTVAILSPHVDAMVADARAASIAVARMSVDYAAGGDRGATSDMDTDRGSRQRAEATDKDNPDDPAPATATRRVRIVL